MGGTRTGRQLGHSLVQPPSEEFKDHNNGSIIMFRDKAIVMVQGSAYWGVYRELGIEDIYADEIWRILRDRKKIHESNVKMLRDIEAMEREILQAMKGWNTALGSGNDHVKELMGICNKEGLLDRLNGYYDIPPNLVTN